MFREQYIRDNEKLTAKETLRMEIQKKATEEQKAEARRSKWVRYGAVAAAFALVAGGILGYAAGNRKNAASRQEVAASAAASVSGTATPGMTAASPAEAAPDTLTTFQNYDELFDAVERITGGRNAYALSGGGLMKAEAATAESAAVDMAASEAAPMAEPAAMADGGNYSTTNVQVAGVDEADIVKTDGNYIYYLANNALTILDANGKDTTLVSRTMLTDGGTWWSGASELFLLGDRLMIVSEGYATVWVNDGGNGYNDDRNAARIDIYDIADRAKPVRVTSLSQSGSYVSSRLVGDYAYIVTSQYVWNPARNTPATYLPYTAADGKETSVPANSIYRFGEPQNAAYTVVGAINLASGTRHESVAALFGGTGEVYCNGAHLLLALPENKQNVSDIHPDTDGKNVRVTTSESETKLVLFALDKGTITELASGRVPGTLLNQFAMDEYKDVIRVVTTYNYWEERVYTNGLDSYEYDDRSYNCLYTLDANLAVLGKIEKLAEDEWVESVRFDGDVGYFVTFRQTDPLFCVDLTNPEKPVVKSKLKIPGFSEYLHGYGNGLLFGIGYDADEKTGSRKGVKLTMFDTAVPTDVRELSTTKLDASWTVVGSNHKAILVDANKNLIAFPADSAYYLYSYTKDGGFTQLARVSMTEDLSSWNLRGLFIGESFYVLSDTTLTVLSLRDYATVAQLTIG